MGVEKFPLPKETRPVAVTRRRCPFLTIRPESVQPLAVLSARTRTRTGKKGEPEPTPVGVVCVALVVVLVPLFVRPAFEGEPVSPLPKTGGRVVCRGSDCRGAGAGCVRLVSAGAVELSSVPAFEEVSPPPPAESNSIESTSSM
ncbi:MAG: hypothetical protein DMF65_00225 [Acidobacteria bacterium]|nr:MAG: hypothetical protein DMF65_00225 [Acidobacteriota bacterium]